MLGEKVFEQINQQVGALLKNNPIEDVEKNIKAVIMAIFNKLDLVTREEFDTQQKVLLATRKKLEEMEEILKKLTENER